MLQTFQKFLIVGAQMDGQEDNSQVMKFNRQCQIRFGTIWSEWGGMLWCTHHVAYFTPQIDGADVWHSQ